MSGLPVALQGFTIGAAGVWTLVALFAIALVKAWPVLLKLKLDDEGLRRSEKRDDLHECNQRLDAMAIRVDALQMTVSNLKVELSGAVAAYRILDAEVEKTNPTSLGLAQARAIMSTAFTVAPSTIPAAEGSPQ